MRIVGFLPLMWLPMAVYAVLAMAQGSAIQTWLVRPGPGFSMPSGDAWVLTPDALMVGFATICLAAELVRSALPTARGMLMLTLLGLSFVLGLVLLIAAKGFATSTFALILLMVLANFLVSATVQIFTARRTWGLQGDILHDRQSAP
jgi:hypothetical protein